MIKWLINLYKEIKDLLFINCSEKSKRKYTYCEICGILIKEKTHE